MQVTIEHTQKDIVPYGGLPILGGILKSIGLANTCNDMPVEKLTLWTKSNFRILSQPVLP